MKTPTIAHLFISSLILLISAPINMVFGAAQKDLFIEQQWLLDTAAELTPVKAMRLFNEGKGQLLESATFRLGAEERQIWLLITVENQSPHNLQRLLLTGVPHSRLLKAMLIQPNQAVDQGRILLDEDQYKPFNQRNNTFRLLNSDSFEIATGAKVWVLVQVAIRGPSYLPLSLISPEDFNQLRLQDSVFAAQFYVFEATLGVLFLLFGLAVKHRVAVLYALMFLLGLLAMADIDGHAFHWLWPNFPTWNSRSPLVVLPILNALGFIIIQQLLRAIDDGRFGWLKPVALSLAGISVLIPTLLPWLPLSTLVQTENLLSILVFILQPIAFAGWVRLGRRNRASWLALLFISLGIAAITVPVFIDIDLPVIVAEHAHHAAYLLVGLMIMIVITVQLMGIRKDQDAALVRDLAFAKREAEMNQALFKAEQNYSKVRHLASLQQRQLASASHDLRQPITSLRATIDAISQQQESGIRQQLQDAFDYLERLCTHYLNENRPDTARQQADQVTTEAFPASLILNTVHRMFAEEAASRQIELRVVDCRVLLQVQPLVLMRMVSNIVANAIKHHSGHDQAKVLLGCRRKSQYLHICICDNGVGMTPETLAELQQPYRKGATSEGEGLGLAIVRQLATENGIAIRIASQVGKGSCFIIETPLKPIKSVGLFELKIDNNQDTSHVRPISNFN